MFCFYSFTELLNQREGAGGWGEDEKGREEALPSYLLLGRLQAFLGLLHPKPHADPS